ncbi:tRNA(Ile)-lysidine synthase [Litorimonas taeanensis]|uniref:tRNA(Ile)-lysidine synthase n=1 Tax=Litorimonas taeanensis TaxID=568099 RepID=A0A420WLN0_9PROT|nr:tRNA lysidine(34) synthetase TilS [Litorimonas taeanensis]RKQ71785.1 tRNA(Ile)-lysidine synthase [Litorimonas taeanensis]
MLKADIEALEKTISDLGFGGAKEGNCAIAFSGGGDSTALLYALRNHPRVNHAFIIDHNLRSESYAESQKSAAFARELGYDAVVQTWIHDTPKTGVQAKARAYRYAAMGEMARQRGLSFLLTAHTEDDQAETIFMRQARDTGWRGLAGMKPRAYGPIWPALADVTLVRPLIGQSRRALRAYNRAHNLTWIEDPSNQNLAFTRVKTRQELRRDPRVKTELLRLQKEQGARLDAERNGFKLWMAEHARIDPQGYFELASLPPLALLGPLLRMASGTGGPIDIGAVDTLISAMQKPDFTAATLAGAWIVKQADTFLVTRDKVAAKGRRGSVSALQATELQSGEPYVWDGRFLIQAHRPGIHVEPIFGKVEAVSKGLKSQDISEINSLVRPTLPLLWRNEAIGFGAGQFDDVSVTALAPKRLSQFLAGF